MTEQRGSLNPRPISPQLPAGAGAGAPAMPEPVAMGEPELVGQLLDGRYQVLQRLGDGMLTAVYEARHSGSGRHFAIKVLRAGLAAKPHILDRFLQQARTAAQIRHDNVVAIEEFGYTPTRSVYAAVELVVADTLQTILERDGRWSWTQARPVALQIVAALQAAHAAGLVHRALRPANCFVVLDPKGKRDPFVKVADFGLAQVGVEASQAATDATAAPSLYGDPEYMAPEQGFGGQSTPATDIYAFGVLLYRVLTGRVPFSSSNPFQTISHHAQKPVPPLHEADPRIPPAVEQLVLQCLAKTPEQRFGSAAQLGQALAAIPAQPQGGPAHAQPPPPAQAAGSGPRFARFNAGGGSGPAAVPPKQPSVIVAGSIGDGAGGISGTLSEAEPPLFDPYAAGAVPHGPGPVTPPAPVMPPPVMPPPVMPGAVGSSPTLMPPAPVGGATSSFLASRPGLRMGLGAAVPSSDGPAPPPTIAPGMAVASPTMFPGASPFNFGPDPGPPSYSPSLDPGLPPPVGSSSYAPEPMVPPVSAGPGYPPLGQGPGMPPAAGGYAPPVGPGAGIPPLGAGPGIPPMGAGGGGYTPPVGAGAGIPPLSQGRGIPPVGAGPGIPPVSAGPGIPPMGAGPGYPPIGAGPGLPPLGQGRGIPPVGVGPGMPPAGAGPGYPPIGAGPGIPPLGQGRGIPPMVPGSGIPPIGAGAGIPPVDDGMHSGSSYSHGSHSPDAAAPSGLGAVEYDQEEEPKRRTWLFVVIGVTVILGGVGLALLIARGLEDPEGDVAKVTRTQKAQDINVEPDAPKPEEPEEPDEPIIEAPPEPKPVKKAAPKKEGQTFEQSLTAMKGRIRERCKKLGAGPVDINTFVDRSGGKANTPKVEPKGPVGDCALKVVQSWDFPASDEDHPVDERVSW